MNLYEKNMEFFKSQSSVLYNTLNNELPNIQTKIEKVEGRLNFIVEHTTARCFIHSVYSQEREMFETFKHVDSEVETLILFGFGCGYAFEYIFERFSKLTNVFLVEPDLQLFKEILKYIDIQSVLKVNKNITFILNKTMEEAALIISKMLVQGSKSCKDIAFNLSYRTLYGEYFEFISTNISKLLQMATVNMVTKHGTLHLYTQNAFRNLKQEYIPFEVLFNKIQDRKIPVVIVSAGPSLNKNMQLLHEVKNKALIVSVGTATKILDSNGIVPHLRMAIDGFPSESIFEGTDTEAAPLLYCEKLHYDVLKNYKGKRFKMVLDTDFMTRFILNEAKASYAMMRSSFSVANVAMDVFCRAGCRKIILMGQDLCYTRQRLYAEGSEDSTNYDFSQPGYIKEKDVSGEDVYTTLGFRGMRTIFEQLIQCYPDTEVVNATQGGLPIRGAVNKDFSGVLQELQQEYSISEMIQEAYAEGEANTIKDQEAIRCGMKKVENDIRRIAEINTMRLKHIKRVSDDVQKSKSLERVFSDIRYFTTYEDELLQIDLYRFAFVPSLDDTFNAIRLSNETRSQDKLDQIKSKINVIIGRISEVQRYVELIQQLIVEYYC